MKFYTICCRCLKKETKCHRNIFKSVLFRDCRLHKALLGMSEIFVSTRSIYFAVETREANKGGDSLLHLQSARQPLKQTSKRRAIKKKKRRPQKLLGTKKKKKAHCGSK